MNEPSMSRDNFWDARFCETADQGFGLQIPIKSFVGTFQSRFQRIDIVDFEYFGRALILYGSVMCTEKDESAYHEMIAHVPLCRHPAPRRVLVIGGGDGGTVREVLRHRDVERVVVCEIDEMVVSLCREHLPSLASSFR